MPTPLPRPWLLALLLAAPAWAQPAPEPTAPADAGPIAAAPAIEPASDAALAEINALAAELAAAILAGDADAYLAHVWPGDPVFFTEQRNWADDIAERTPITFEIELAPLEPTADPDPQTPERAAPDAQDHHLVEMTVRWQMSDTAPRRTVTFPARFRRDPDADRWLYAGRAWRTHQSDAVRVHYDRLHEPTARRSLESMPEVIAHVRDGFELPATDAIQEIKIYPDMASLQFSIYPSYTDPLSGWNEPGESIKLLGSAALSGDHLMSLLAHEYGHVATFELGEAMKDVPWWIAEGVAELAAERWSHAVLEAGDEAVRALAQSGNLVPWDQLTDFRTVPPHLHMHVYLQGHHMLGYISQRFGRAGRNAWLAALARGLSLDNATRDALGLPFADLDAAWRESLKADEAK